MRWSWCAGTIATSAPTLATKALQERHGIKVGRETVRKWMAAGGLWLSRKQRRTFHQPRLWRESYGELVQIIRLQNLNNPGAPFNHSDQEHEREYRVHNVVSWSHRLQR